MEIWSLKDKVEQGKCLCEPCVCQSRNWEAFWAELWGQGLPKAPLQNNTNPPSRPSSWQWAWACCLTAFNPVLSFHTLRAFKMVTQKSRSKHHFADMICLVCANALCEQTCLWTDVRHNKGQDVGSSYQPYGWMFDCHSRTVNILGFSVRRRHKCKYVSLTYPSIPFIVFGM